MAVALLPYDLPRGFRSRLADLPLDRVSWPLGQAAEGATLADLRPGDHLIIHFSSPYMLAIVSLMKLACCSKVPNPPLVAPVALQLTYWPILDNASLVFFAAEHHIACSLRRKGLFILEQF